MQNADFADPVKISHIKHISLCGKHAQFCVAKMFSLHLEVYPVPHERPKEKKKKAIENLFIFFIDSVSSYKRYSSITKNILWHFIFSLRKLVIACVDCIISFLINIVQSLCLTSEGKTNRKWSYSSNKRYNVYCALPICVWIAWIII